MRIKVEPFLMKKGNRVAKAAIEFTDGILKGFHLVGFTICDDAEKGTFVLFPAITTKREEGNTEKPRTFFFLRPNAENLIADLEEKILDVYDSMTGKPTPFNTPKVVEATATETSTK